MYMWRFTHDPKYRDWGWEAVQVGPSGSLLQAPGGRGGEGRGGDPRRRRILAEETLGGGGS